MLAPGTKVPSPHVRATFTNGTIHAILRQNPLGAKALCGKVTVDADQPLRRFQRGLGKKTCLGCTHKVDAAREQVVKDRKMQRSKKNRPKIAGAEVPAAAAVVAVAIKRLPIKGERIPAAPMLALVRIAKPRNTRVKTSAKA